MSQTAKYQYMSRKELASAAGVSERTLYSYISTIWNELVARGCTSGRKLTPAAVEYICEHFGITL